MIRHAVRKDDPCLDLVGLAHSVLDAARDGRDAPALSADTRSKMIAAIKSMTGHASGLDLKSDAYVASFFAATHARHAERLARSTGK